MEKKEPEVKKPVPKKAKESTKESAADNSVKFKE